MHSTVQNNIQITVRLQTVTTGICMISTKSRCWLAHCWFQLAVYMVTWNLHWRNDDVDGGSNWLIMTAAVRFWPSGIHSMDCRQLRFIWHIKQCWYCSTLQEILPFWLMHSNWLRSNLRTTS